MRKSPPEHAAKTRRRNEIESANGLKLSKAFGIRMDEFVDAKIHCTKNKYIYNFLAAKCTHTQTRMKLTQAPAAAARRMCFARRFFGALYSTN